MVCPLFSLFIYFNTIDTNITKIESLNGVNDANIKAKSKSHSGMHRDSKQHLGLSYSEKDGLLNAFNPDLEKETIKSRWIEGTFICFSACVIALEVKNLNLMLTLAGATYGCYIMFILPSLLYIKSIRKTKRIRDIDAFEAALVYFAYTMLLVGAVICVAGITTAFM